MEIKIRNIKKETVCALDEIASSHHISRNTLLLSILKQYTQTFELKKTENKYTEIINTMADVIAKNTETIKQTNEIIKNL